jgi:hypothetical protein
MSRASFLVFPLCVTLSGCGAVADVVGAAAGAGHGPVASIKLNVPDSLFVGDTVPINADSFDKDGKTPTGDTLVTWRASDAGVVAFNPGVLPIPTPHGWSRIIGLRSGQTMVTAQVAQVTASKLVTVVGAGDIAQGDQRFGYALADQPAATAPYAPDPAYRFNSSGGAVMVTHDSVGIYLVRFAGLGRKPGQRDNSHVTAYGASLGTFCKLYEPRADGTDMVVPVHCHAPGADGPFVDAKFTVLFAGARAFDPSSPFAFAERLPGTQNIVLDTSQTAFNSATGHISMGGGGGGGSFWNFVFPGLEHPSAPVALLATGVGQGPEHCRVSNYDLNVAVLQAGCSGPDGAPIAARVSVMWFTRGRVGHRFAFVSAANPAGAASPNDASFTFNSTGGAIVVRRTGTGQYTATFAGLARPAGATEIVIVSAFKDFDHRCGITSWGKTGANDLAVTFTCFDATGKPFDGRSMVLVVE